MSSTPATLAQRVAALQRRQQQQQQQQQGHMQDEREHEAGTAIVDTYAQQQSQQAQQAQQGHEQAEWEHEAAATWETYAQQQQQQQREQHTPSVADVFGRAALLQARATGSSNSSSGHSAGAAGGTATAAARTGWCQEQQLALLHRMQVLQQRQSDEQGGTAAAAARCEEQQRTVLQRMHVLQHRQGSQSDGAAAAADAGDLQQQQQSSALLQRLQVLLQRQDSQQQHVGAAAATPAIAGGGEQQQQASLLQRLHVLQQRQANTRTVLAAAAATAAETAAETGQDAWSGDASTPLQDPSDFVQCLKQLLATENLANFTGEVQCEAGEARCELRCEDGEVCEERDTACCEDADMACCRSWEAEGTSGAEQAAAAAEIDAAAAAGTDAAADVASPMCMSPTCQHAGAAGPKLWTNLQHHHQQQQQQIQQQPAAAPAPPPPEAAAGPSNVPDHLHRLLILASQSLCSEQYSEARDRAAAALAEVAVMLGSSSSSNSSSAGGSSSSAFSSFCKDAERIAAMAVVLEQVPQQHWLGALQLPPPPPAAAAGAPYPAAAAAAAAAAGSNSVVGPAVVKRAYRRLAGLIHPDKCRHPSAEAAFKALATAYQQAVSQLSATASSAAAAAGDIISDSWDTVEPEMTDGQQNDESDNGHAWWTEWERDVADGRVDGAAAAGGAWAKPTSQPTAADEEEELWRISMQELAAEVERRQAGVFQPQSEQDAARPPLARQKRLRVARTVLSARLQQQRAAAATEGVAGIVCGSNCMSGEVGSSAAAAAVGGGGFIPTGGQEWGDWKRQRL